MRPRIYGSTVIQMFFTWTSPGAGSGTVTIASSKFSALGMPTGRDFKRISRDVTMSKTSHRVAADLTTQSNRLATLALGLCGAAHHDTRPKPDSVPYFDASVAVGKSVARPG